MHLFIVFLAANLFGLAGFKLLAKLTAAVMAAKELAFGSIAQWNQKMGFEDMEAERSSSAACRDYERACAALGRKVEVDAQKLEEVTIREEHLLLLVREQVVLEAFEYTKDELGFQEALARFRVYSKNRKNSKLIQFLMGLAKDG